MLGIALVTVFLATYIPHMRPDFSLNSGISRTDPSFERYRKFLDVFGNEEFILIAVRTEDGASDPGVLKALERITRELEETEDLVEVQSLSNLSLFRQRNNKFGTYPLILDEAGKPRLPDREELQRTREFVPLLDLLLSKDLKTLGLVAKVSERSRLDPPLIDRLLERMDAIVKKHAPGGSDYRFIGTPVIIRAIQRYNLRTAVYFGIVCLLVAAIVSVYIFKSLRVTVITMLVIVTCVVWMMGLMIMTGIRLNSTTSLSFGLVLIVSVAAVIHIVTHFNERFRQVGDRLEGAREALLVVARPCLMCSLTTATGFASITVSSNIPMVQQLGLIMSMGTLLSYLLAIIITPTLLIMMRPPRRKTFKRMDRDLVALLFERMERFVFRYPGHCALAGLFVVVLLLSALPRIQSDTQILRMLTDSTREVQDIRFVAENLTPVHSLELVVEGDKGAFKKADAWRKVRDLDRRLTQIPEVVRTDSLLPVIQFLYGTFSDKDPASEELFNNPGIIPELQAVMGFSREGKKILRRYADDRFGAIRISVRIRNSPTTPIGDTIEEVRSAASDAMKGTAAVSVTGALALFDAQGSELVRSQTISLLLALTCITILMIVQFRSFSLGLLSLIPNLLPLTVIFGFMGWFGIPLDSVTVFAATVSIGLSVDDTIHYLTQLRREIGSARPGSDIEKCLAGAYRITAKALISTSAVLFLGFLMLVWSPFRPVIYFGVLGSSAVLAALVGDLVFMPSIILSVKPIKTLLNRAMSPRTPA